MWRFPFSLTEIVGRTGDWLHRYTAGARLEVVRKLLADFSSRAKDC